MRVFKSKHFSRYARKEGIEDTVLANAIREIENGLVDGVLGGGLVKKRVAREGGGKSSGYRTLIAFSSGRRSLFYMVLPKMTVTILEMMNCMSYENFLKSF